MCVYCMMADHTFRNDPPWNPLSYPYYPPPVPPPIAPAVSEWDLQRLKEYEALLKRVRGLEEAVGCPVEPNKADYLGLLEKRIAYLEGVDSEREIWKGRKLIE